MDYTKARETMVEQQVRPWYVLDVRVLDVLVRLPREAVVPETHRALAYADIELPPGHGQPIMKPVVYGRPPKALELQPRHPPPRIDTHTRCPAPVQGPTAR